MNAHPRQFVAKAAVRETVPLFIGLVGPSSSGKTYSALTLAEGIQRVTGGDIHLIDTENRRGLHYADRFKYQHIQFDPPFGSLDYLAAMQQSVAVAAAAEGEGASCGAIGECGEVGSCRDIGEGGEGEIAGLADLEGFCAA
jgi:predicted ABC-type transport system involved in lysophospholipase L1 biosynthesis ATPase subunit